ncbi:hypothetical protein ACFQPG_05835 [Sphingomonas sp. GCM10030256]|uniref:hypothetical protein n=1 Tax=Sphingomonas sp. GCM10030256 TaxID=3273427 RepID=UPI00361938AE
MDRGRGLTPFTIAALFACMAVAVQSLAVPIDGDVSWLITVAERVLGGQRLYRDIFEVNPPASVWLYIPPVWLAQLIGARPEGAVAGTAILAALVSIAATMRLATRLDRAPDPRWLAGIAAFLLLLYPGGLFAQREHFAAILALPVVTGLAISARGNRLPLRTELLLGAAAGAIAVLKPHLALAVALPGSWAAWRCRSLRPFLPALSAAALVLLAYAAALLLLARDYLGYIPVLRETYVPMREKWYLLLAGPVVFIPAALFALAFVLRARPWPLLAVALFLGSAGFVLAGVIQGKGYGNHGLPGSILAFAALACLWMTASAAPERRRLVALAAAVLLAGQLYVTHSILPRPGLAQSIRRVAPPRPSMITLGTELVTGHPAVRHVDGSWAGSRASLFIAAGVQNARPAARSPDKRRKLEQWYQADLRSFAIDVARNRPDVVLVERPEKQWMFREPVLAGAMRDYRFAEQAGEIEVWIRRNRSR